MSFEIEIWSDREFQRMIKKEMDEKFPEIECHINIKKSDVLQYTQIAIGIASLIAGILGIIIATRNKTDKKINIKIRSDEKEIELTALNHDVDINKIIRDFLKRK